MVCITHREGDVRQCHTSTGARRLRGPVLVDVKAIRSAMCHEGVERHISNIARALVALDHEHLVAAVGVYVPKGRWSASRTVLHRPHLLVLDFLDCSTVRQAANGAATGLVAPN